jgi:hypothetical protein
MENPAKNLIFLATSAGLNANEYGMAGYDATDKTFDRICAIDGLLFAAGGGRRMQPF